MLLDCQVNLTAVMDATNELLLSLRNLNDARLAPATYVMHVAVMREFLHIDDDTDGFEQFFDTLTIAAQPCQRPVEQVHPDVHDIAMTAAADMVVGNTTLAGYRRSVETSIDRAANAKVHATGSITKDEIVNELAKDSGNGYHHPWKSDLFTQRRYRQFVLCQLCGAIAAHSEPKITLSCKKCNRSMTTRVWIASIVAW